MILNKLEIWLLGECLDLEDKIDNPMYDGEKQDIMLGKQKAYKETLNKIKEFKKECQKRKRKRNR